MKDNQRLCVGCFERHLRQNMLRILKKYDTGEIVLDPSNKDFGRSVYICKNNECVEKAFKKGKLSKFLRSLPSDELKFQIRQKLN